MNRIFQTVLCIFLFGLPVQGQEPDTIFTGSGTTGREADTTFMVPDTIFTETPAIGRESYIHLREPDSTGLTPAAIDRQADTVHRAGRRDRNVSDTLQAGEPDFSHSPSRAVMFALVLPGLGQAYNKKYYKIPIVYVALGVAGYAINYNTHKYREASLAYARDQSTTNEEYLHIWRRYMEISFIAMGAVYALQVLDAYVDAQLYYWDVNENLSLRLAPSLQPVQVPAEVPRYLPGLTCSIALKGR
jgi:hypothetical protein